MKLKIQKPRQALNKAYLKVKPTRSEIENFKANLLQLLDNTNNFESEEFHKNLVIEFLKKTYYDSKYFINTKGRNDLVIHNEKNASSEVGVIIETKKPTNSSEMVTKENLNVKAFHELVFYYLKERITHKNLEVKHLVITNINEWFIFESNTFDRLFAQNKTLVKQFKDFEAGRLSGIKTDFFYKEIAEPLISKIETEITFAYFDIREYNKPLRNENKTDDNKLIALFKLLSPEHLLKLPFANDSNSLDKSFYNELLHIIGLKEVKEGSKKLIGRAKEGERNRGSILENAIIHLDSLDKLSRIERPSRFGGNMQERTFNVALELTITWLNRILFLKLLEAQLITYHKGDRSYSFLNLDKIKDYDDLNTLFFRVLARKYEDRHSEINQIFGKVPYLNSSLFEPSELEHETLFISNLKHDKTIPIISSTVLKDENGKRKTGKLSTLDYLFQFLDAYDFSSEGSEDIQEENKTLVNASVLGLFFEKINGYKDGSFFTPGFITMYMCHETIRKAVVQKFNETKNWNCKNLDDVYDKIEDRKEANEIVNSIKICDPAVGSGHFLVSALNEMIAIKSDLKILQDRNGRRLKEYSVVVANDELVVTDEDGELFEYNPNNKESQRIQETLFHEKQTIIESCLFGVDLNNNSVKICRLRLWIELLKNAYYKNNLELETLPNIDINIKCGNSLVSRFALDSDLQQALKKSKWTISSYRLAVSTYRNAENKEQKREMENLINDIKSDFRSEISYKDPIVKNLQKLSNQLNQMTQQQLFEMSKKEQKAWDKKVQELTKQTNKLESEIEEIKTNKIFENAFEWRFEFPEVLNDNGDFVGFDVVIGNPPYGVSIKGKVREFLVKNLSKVPDYEIYYWFIDRAYQILKVKGVLTYIIPNSLLFNVYSQNYRFNLFNSWELYEIIDCTDINIFEDAVVRNIIIQFTKEKQNDKLGYRKTNNDRTFQEIIDRERVEVNKTTVENYNKNWALIFKLNKNVLDIVKKIKNEKSILSYYFDVTQGYIPYRKSDLIKLYGKEKANSIITNREWHSSAKINQEYKEEIFGESISKYGFKPTGSYVWYGKHLATYVDPRFFNQKRLLIREITNPSIIASIVTEEFVNDPQIIVVIPKNNEFSIEYLWCIMNSKLASFYHFNSSPKATKGAFPKILVTDIKNFPLPTAVDEQDMFKISNKISEVLELKKQNHSFNTTNLENELDLLVYKLYDLTEEEIKIIESL